MMLQEFWRPTTEVTAKKENLPVAGFREGFS